MASGKSDQKVDTGHYLGSLDTIRGGEINLESTGLAITAPEPVYRIAGMAESNRLSYDYDNTLCVYRQGNSSRPLFLVCVLSQDIFYRMLLSALY